MRRLRNGKDHWFESDVRNVIDLPANDPRPIPLLVAGLAFLLILTAGCLDPYADSFARARISPSDLVARYEFAWGRGKGDSAQPGAIAILDLRADGRCTVVPFYPDERVWPYDGQTTWRLAPAADNTRTSAVFIRRGDRQVELHVRGERPEFTLLCMVEADAEDAFELRRANPAETHGNVGDTPKPPR